MLGMLLLAQVVALPAIRCPNPAAEPQPLYLCRADARARDACVVQLPHDARPFTLCLAETYDNEVERELGKQIAAALRRAERHGGAWRQARLRAEQRGWERGRARRCGAEAQEAPVPEQARAELTCLARVAVARIEALSAPAARR